MAELMRRGEADLQTGPFGTQLKASDYVESGVPVINVRNIGFGKLREGKLEFVHERTAEKLKVHLLEKGDIVFGRKGSSDRHVLIDKETEGWLQGSDCLRLRIKSNLVCNKYFSFYFDTSGHKYWMEAVCSFGATMTSLNQDIVKRITVPLPPIKIQEKIAAILSAYDDLIENNKRRIALLEKMAEQIYREWFVRMRFPGHERAKFEKGIPADWKIETIGQLCVKVTDGSHFSPSFVENGKYMASVKDMHDNGFSIRTLKTISVRDFENLTKADCQPLKNDVLIAKDGSYLKHVFVWDAAYDIVILSSIAILRPNLKKIKPHFLTMVLKQNSTKSMMSGYVSGSALPRIILKDFKKMKLLIPTFDLLLKFESIIEPMYKTINLSYRKNEHLETSRDMLLARLISGKLPVEKLDIEFPPGMVDEGDEGRPVSSGLKNVSSA